MSRRLVAPVVLVLAGIVTAVLLVGCGVPPDPSPRTIKSGDVPTALRSPKTTWRVYLFKQDRLAGVDRSITLSADRLTTLRAALAGLRQKPSAQEVAEGYESDMWQPENTVEVASVSGRTVTVDLLDSQLQQDGKRLGQIVLTLTELSDVDRVDFVAHGQALPLRQVKGPNYEDLTLPVSRDQFPFLRREETVKLYFVRDGQLRAVERQIDVGDPDDPTDVVAGRYLAPLVIDGPTAPQQADGYRSSVADLSPTLFCSTTSSDGPCDYTLDLSPAFLELPPAQQVLALGQLLYTLEGWPRGSLGNVEIRVNGNRLSQVPGPDGPLPNPVDKSAYESLLG